MTSYNGFDITDEILFLENVLLLYIEFSYGCLTIFVCLFFFFAV